MEYEITDQNQLASLASHLLDLAARHQDEFGLFLRSQTLKAMHREEKSQKFEDLLQITSAMRAGGFLPHEIIPEEGEGQLFRTSDVLREFLWQDKIKLPVRRQIEQLIERAESAEASDEFTYRRSIREAFDLYLMEL